MWLYTLFGAFFALMILIGLYFQQKDSSAEDYFLGGRALGPYVTAMSMVASDMSGWLLLGIPGLVYLEGLSSTWILLGVLLGSYSSWLVVGEYVRHRSKELGSVTLPDLLSKLVGDESSGIRLLSAFITLLFLIFYTSSGLVTSAKLFESTLQLPYHYGLVLSALCVALYTSLGGFLAVSFTDVIQVSLVLFAVIALPLVLLSKGASSEVEMAQLSFFTNASGENLRSFVIMSMVFWGLGYFGQPHLLVRFKAAKNSSVIKQAKRIALSINIILLISVTLIGILGFSYCQMKGVLVEDSEKLVFLLANLLFHPFIAGLVSLAVLAAVMSTADSQLLICASCVSEDIFKGKSSHKKLGQFSVFLAALVSVVLAWNPESSVLDLVSYGWAGFGASFGPVILFSRFFTVNKQGAYTSFLVGSMAVILWRLFGDQEIYAIFPAFLASSFCLILAKIKLRN